LQLQNPWDNKYNKAQVNDDVANGTNEEDRDCINTVDSRQLPNFTMSGPLPHTMGFNIQAETGEH
jgi:hypothetical protein